MYGVVRAVAHATVLYPHREQTTLGTLDVSVVYGGLLYGCMHANALRTVL